MTTIEVRAIMEWLNGDAYTYGGEVGTPEFYTVKDTLQAHLGYTIWVTNHAERDTYLVEDSDEGCDHTYDFVRFIESIYEPASRKRHLYFDIVHME